LVLSLWTAWIARGHLIRAARVAFSRRAGRGDAEEPLSYRWAFLGFLASFAFIVYFMWVANCRLTFGIVVALLTVGYFAIWARLRAETGLGFLSFLHQIPELAMVPFGSRIFRVSEVVALVTLRSFYTPGFSYSFEVFPGAALESFKVADSARINARRLTWALTVGFLVSLVAGILIFMAGVYHYGWFSFYLVRTWVSGQALGDGGRIVDLLTDASMAKTDVNGLIAVLAGGAVVVILGLLRLRYWWWPFHPVGYLASNTWGFHGWWWPFLVGWAGKALVIRYGGLRLYRSTVPFAIGLIVGELMNGGIWATVRVVSQGHI
jgi:hypothetical protein